MNPAFIAARKIFINLFRKKSISMEPVVGIAANW